MLTVEDVVEEILGEIEDEHDHENELEKLQENLKKYQYQDPYLEKRPFNDDNYLEMINSHYDGGNDGINGTNTKHDFME